MKSVIFRCLASVMILALSSCASSGVRPPSYTYGGRNAIKPDAEKIQVDPKKPMGYVWSRWDEEPKGRIFVNSGNVISSRHLSRLLENSQNPQVLEKLNQYKDWSNVGTYSSLALVVGALSTGLGYIRKSDGSTTFSIATINIFWGISAIALGTTMISLLQQDYYLNQALEAHNARTRPSSFKMSSLIGEEKAELQWGIAF